MARSLSSIKAVCLSFRRASHQEEAEALWPATVSAAKKAWTGAVESPYTHLFSINNTPRFWHRIGMNEPVIVCGRLFRPEVIDHCNQLAAVQPPCSGNALARETCSLLAWYSPDGRPALSSAKVALRKLRRRGVLVPRKEGRKKSRLGSPAFSPTNWRCTGVGPRCLANQGENSRQRGNFPRPCHPGHEPSPVAGRDTGRPADAACPAGIPLFQRKELAGAGRLWGRGNPDVPLAGLGSGTHDFCRKVNQDGRLSARSKGQKKGFRRAYLGSLGSQLAGESHSRADLSCFWKQVHPGTGCELFRAPASVGCCCSGAAKMPVLRQRHNALALRFFLQVP